MRLQFAPGGTILAGVNGQWGEYNTSISSRTQYELSVVSCYQAPIYLNSLFVKISALIASADYEILVLDTNMTALAINDGGVAGVIAKGGRIITVSDVKEIGGVWGYDPPSEEMLTMRHCGVGPEVESVIELKGRPFMQGLAVALVTAADGAMTLLDSALFVDARWISGQ